MVLFTKDIEPDGLIRPGAEFQKFKSLEELRAAVVLADFAKDGIIGIQKGSFLDGWGKMKDPSAIDLEILNEKVFGSGVRIVEPSEFFDPDGKTIIFPVEPVYVPVYKSDDVPFDPPAPPKDLRDEFAMVALKELAPLMVNGEVDDYLPQFVAEDCYKLADAMMERRKK